MAVEERDKAHLADMLAAARDANPQIPWTGIIGTRNALAHQYGAIDYRRLHATANEGALLGRYIQIRGQVPTPSKTKIRDLTPTKQRRNSGPDPSPAAPRGCRRTETGLNSVR